MTEADVVEAVAQTIPSSKWKLKSYAEELQEVCGSRLQSTGANDGLVTAD